MSWRDASYLEGWSERIGHSGLHERLDTLTLPTRRDEDWRFIRLKDFAGSTFGRTLELTSTPDSDAIIAERAYDDVGARLVFVNGVWDKKRSEGALDGVTIVHACEPKSLDEHVGDLVEEGFGQDYFTQINASAWVHAVAIHVDKSTSVSGTLHLLFVNTGDAGISTHPFVHVHVGAGSKVDLIEEHVGTGETAHWTNAVVEAQLEANARLNHVKLQCENTSSFHVARTAVRLKDGAHYDSISATFGAKLSRHDLWADIQGSNTTCELHGMAIVSGDQVADTHSTMNHARPGSMSDQLHKCIVGDSAHAVFNGRIVVQQAAQQTNAFQLNRNLLLSNRAKIDTKPQLEIFADDVKCSHGATIGQLDEDQLFYLRSRGISPEKGLGMLTYAFAAELIDKVPVEGARGALADLIGQHISAVD